MRSLCGTARRPDQLLHSFQRRRRPPASDWLSAPVRELSHGQRVLTAGQPLLTTTGTHTGEEGAGMGGGSHGPKVHWTAVKVSPKIFYEQKMDYSNVIGTC
ncbi:hypothetical protein NQZ68_001884 [Dissostichus eleginoides]|nr:hypothetical protein NQZ68_001884 [Dissostichus eleginoides]